jgi:Zn-dependent protease with chaperone function
VLFLIACPFGSALGCDEPIHETDRSHSAEAIDETTPIGIPEPTAKALAFHRSGNWIWAFARFWDLAVPAAILISGLSARMRDFGRRVGRVWIVSVAIYLSLFLLVVFLADLPLRYFAGFVRGHAYGLSNQSIGKWFGDSLKGLGVEMLCAVTFGWIPFALIARWPRAWWLILSMLMVPWLAFVVGVAPVLRDPLFNNFTPIQDKALESKILELATRSGIEGARVFQVDKSVDTNTTNAYVTGLFGTKRIVLWDTLLKKFDDREILSVMGHEMGHYVLNHVGWSITLSSLILLAGFAWTDRAGRWLIARYSSQLGMVSLADVAATPLILILLGISSTLLAPVVLAYSRHNEHEADRFSLELTHMNRSSARAFVDLQRDNLSVPHHSLVETLWRATHPSIAERITFCNTYHPWSEGRPIQ